VVLVDTAYADDLKGETFKHRKSVKEKDLSVPAQNKSELHFNYENSNMNSYNILT